MTNTLEGFHHLEARLRELGLVPQDCLVALEKSSGLLVGYLLDHGYTVYPINPKAVDRYRDRLRVSGAKSDPLDALVLAHILRTDRDLHRPLLPSSPLAQELKCITRSHEDLVEQRTRLTNQIKACLKEYYPAALTFFSSVDQPLALAFLEAFPTPEAARRLSAQELETFCFQRCYRNRTGIRSLYEKMQAPSLQAPPWLATARSQYLLALVTQMVPLQKAISGFERQLQSLLDQHPDSPVFLSLPGAGTVLAARLLAELGDCRDNFPTPEALQAEAGTAPVTKRSGHRLSTLFRRACRKRLRNAFQQFSRESVRLSPWAREYYQRQRDHGKSSSRAFRALANRWAAILWKMWQQGLPYDEDYHQANRARCLLHHAQPTILAAVSR